ncbi:MAG TPA: DUF58 domain-containing protein, partial [Arthrobacter sp.]|nr:DUF58 domain-containing protein [Arthrobacter sp.]
MSTTKAGAGRIRLKRLLHKAAPERSSKLHPASLLKLARETAALAGEYLSPHWQRTTAVLAKYVQPTVSIVSPLGWIVLGTAVLLFGLGAAYGWAEA